MILNKISCWDQLKADGRI